MVWKQIWGVPGAQAEAAEGEQEEVVWKRQVIYHRPQWKLLLRTSGHT